ncbi:Oidioi.mRNA.OKI2018_I69.chr2.g5921.t1.cds [Oikopleura dioica]|uniref:Nucleolar protein 6 n=1 Tax=Oikopleura dioica TaxID=34765 RepID=A0ABN7T7U1_OIKDI|nr:Oidioi.mRNA.OKI2018_I69.chr2.g5921.t1.cds [Oikopleura dioica]
MTAIDDGPEAKKAKMFAAPTVEEVAALREAEGIFSGRLSQLKTDEILREITPSQSELNELSEILGAIRTLMKKLPKLDDMNLEDVGTSVKDSVIPIVMSPPSDKGLVRFLPPSRISLIDLDSSVKYDEKIEARIEFEMPKACLQEKDVWDERFFRKRAIYMAYLATVLTKKFDVSYRIVNGLRIKPMMILSNEKFQITCEIKTEVEFAKRVRFIPSRCNIHYNWWAQISEDDSIPAETTLYNSAMLDDQISFEQEEKDLLEKFSSLPPSLNNASRLFKLWTRQSCIHHFESSPDFFKTYALTLLVKNRMPRLASAFQIFRLVLESLAAGDLSSLSGLSDTEWPAPCLGSTQGRNLLSNVPLSACEWLRFSAARDSKILAKDLSNGVISTLVNKRSFLSLSHAIVLLPDDGSLQCVLKRNRNDTRIAALSGDTATTALEYLILLLKNAVTDRIVAICPKVPEFKPWSTVQQPPKSEEVFGLGFGISLSESETNNLAKVFRGPAADNDSAKRFRSLWGAKADERRFQDGSICVAAHFDSEDPLEAAVRHLLKFHGQIEKVEYFGRMQSENRADFAEYQKLSDGYAELEQILRSNDLDLPLRITHLWPVSPTFRGTSSIPFSPKASHLPKAAYQYNVDVPEAKSLPSHFASNRILLQLEGSSKWPQNIQAIRKLRQAYHIRLAEILANKFQVNNKLKFSLLFIR